MALCKKCGQPLLDGLTFCTACGTPIEQSGDSQEQSAAPQLQTPQGQGAAPQPQVPQEQSAAPQPQAPQPQVPQQQYAAPQPQVPQQQYAAPQPQASQQQYAAPLPQAPQQQYAAPQSQAPQQGYAAPQQQYAAPQQPYAVPQPGYQQPYGAQPIDPDIQQNRGIAWLAYLGLFLLIPLFARKKSEYCRFHVGQGMILLLFDLAYSVATQVLLALIDLIFPGIVFYGIYAPSTIYTIFNILFSLGYIGILVFSIIGIVNAASGKKNELPLFGKMTFVKSFVDKIYAALNKE